MCGTLWYCEKSLAIQFWGSGCPALRSLKDTESQSEDSTSKFAACPQFFAFPLASAELAPFKGALKWLVYSQYMGKYDHELMNTIKLG